MEHYVAFVNLQTYYIKNVLNDQFIMLFMATLLVDVLTGNIVALYQRKWNSKTGLNGTLKHLSIITLVFLLLPIISYTTNIPPVY